MLSSRDNRQTAPRYPREFEGVILVRQIEENALDWCSPANHIGLSTAEANRALQEDSR